MWFLATSLSPGLYQRCSMPFPCEGGGEAGRDEEEMGERGHQTHGMGRGKTCLRRGPRSLLLSPGGVLPGTGVSQRRAVCFCLWRV